MARIYAEWEPQSAVIIAWPARDGDFSNLEDVESSYRDIAKAISRFQRLLILCKDSQHQAQIEKKLERNDNIGFCFAEYNDIWLRDTLFVPVEIDQTTVLLNFQFNGWGEKYPFALDKTLSRRLQRTGVFSDTQLVDVDFVLEGGSIESDGCGTLLTTSHCLFNPNRNPQLSHPRIAEQLRHSLGTERIFWLEQAELSGDDTDAHIDTLARFCHPQCIAYTCCDDDTDPHYSSLKTMEQQLQSFRSQQGEPYQLIPLPLPKAVFDADGYRLPANYANFLIINGAVLVPIYDDPKDEIVLARLANGFPDREIIAIPCKPLVHQYGSLHCMTQQLPADVRLIS